MASNSGVTLVNITVKLLIFRVLLFQYKVLCAIINEPWYINIDDLHSDLQIITVQQEIENVPQSMTCYSIFLTKEVNRTPEVVNDVHRLKWTKPTKGSFSVIYEF